MKEINQNPYEGLSSLARPREENMSNLRPMDRVSRGAINILSEDKATKELIEKTDPKKLEEIVKEEMVLSEKNWTKELSESDDPGLEEKKFSNSLAGRIKTRLLN